MGADKRHKGMVVGRHHVFTLQVTQDDSGQTNHRFLYPTTAILVNMDEQANKKPLH